MLQKEVSETPGTTVCTVGNWGKNRSNPSLAFIPKIIQFLGYVPYDTSNQDFGKKIAARRRLLGLRQKDLARLIRVDPSTIKHWEKGEHRPEKRLLKRLAALFINNQLPYRPPTRASLKDRLGQPRTGQPVPQTDSPDCCQD